MSKINVEMNQMIKGNKSTRMEMVGNENNLVELAFRVKNEIQVWPEIITPNIKS